MGRECGFSFYKLVNNKLVDAPVITVDYGNGHEQENYLNICGRCEATDIFLTAVCNKERCHYGWSKTSLKPEEKYTARLLLNHPELDGFEVHKDKADMEFGDPEWFTKFFYVGFEKFKNLFDFDEAQKEHDDCINVLKEEITNYRKEIESLRIHQENAKTKVAFDGFEESINEIKEKIQRNQTCIKETEEDDYGYDPYMYIKNDLEIAEKLMKDDADLIVAIYASD